MIRERFSAVFRSQRLMFIISMKIKKNKAFRRLFSDYPFFYKLFFALVTRRKRAKRADENAGLFEWEVDYFISGYQRSGNTWLFSLLRYFFPEKRAVHHLHKLAPVKMALRKKVPAIILVRDPAECISSNYLKHYATQKDLPPLVNKDLLELMLEDYFFYYRYIRRNQYRIHVVPFVQLTEDPARVIRDIARRFGEDMEGRDLPAEIQAAYASFQGSTDKMGSSKPNPYKEAEKKKIKTHLVKLERFSDCQKVYQQILADFEPAH